MTHKEGQMQSTDLEEIKTALWEQACHPCTQVKWGMAQVMSVKKTVGVCSSSFEGEDAGIQWKP